MGRPAEAYAYFEAAADSQQRLFIGDTVDGAMELSRGYAWLADAARSMGNLALALDHRRIAVTMLEEAQVLHPDDWRLVSDLRRRYLGLGHIALSTGAYMEAVAAFEAARGASDRQFARDPNNKDALLYRVGAELGLVATLMDMGQEDRAREHMRAAHEVIAERSVDIDSPAGSYARYLSAYAQVLSAALQGRGQLRPADRQALAALTARMPAEQQQSELKANWQRLEREAQLMLAVDEQAQNGALAPQTITHLQALLAQPRRPASGGQIERPGLVYLRGRAADMLGARTQAKALLAEAQNAGFQRRYMFLNRAADMAEHNTGENTDE